MTALVDARCPEVLALLVLMSLVRGLQEQVVDLTDQRDMARDTVGDQQEKRWASMTLSGDGTPTRTTTTIQLPEGGTHA